MAQGNKPAGDPKAPADEPKAGATAPASQLTKEEGAEQSEKSVTPLRVQVILESGTLGPLLLTKGAITDDPRYVAMLRTPRGRRLVKEIK